ncbi:MAG TPA: dTDP-glucose 4,6-dehydratase [Dehalococcoidia bacterium]|nr:dTDP-glucose 4,6-dehydratase [Dehalococcoidia bacterium]
MTRYLITGGCGFIGSNFIRRLLAVEPDAEVVNLDALTYAGNLENLRDVEHDPRYRFVHGDIRDAGAVREAMRGAEVVVNFAAETHVDRSLLDAGEFVRTDVYGTFVLLNEASKLPAGQLARFLHISTDEVYGDVPPGRSSKESDALRPRSPYSASKAGAEMMCLAFYETFGLPVVISRASNTFGPYQYPEKVLPLFITNALDDLPLPVYGDGLQVRDWLFIEDHCRALQLVLERGEPGEIYNVGAGNERTNIEVACRVLDLLEKPRSLIRHVEDRPGHDRRYSLDTTKLRALGWSPCARWEDALEETVRWYREHREWWERIKLDPRFQEYYRRQYAERLANGRPAPLG